MEDRYLFKAKILDNGEWGIGFLSIHKTGKCFIRPIVGSALSSVEVEKNTICQCTGLKDRNGKLVWENDIVKAKYEDGFEEITEVAYSKNGYSPYLNEYECEGCCCYCKVTEVEVIGNIFDNPELLESEV